VAIQPATQLAVRPRQRRELRPEQDRRRELLRDGLLDLLACERHSLRVDLQAADRQHNPRCTIVSRVRSTDDMNTAGVTDAASVATVLVVPGMMTNVG